MKVELIFKLFSFGAVLLEIDKIGRKWGRMEMS
jgi:hypothetical protein